MELFNGSNHVQYSSTADEPASSILVHISKYKKRRFMAQVNKPNSRSSSKYAKNYIQETLFLMLNFFSIRSEVT